MWGQTGTVIDSVSVKQIRKGDRGTSVKILQEALLEIGRGLNIKNSGGADGSFGSGTQKDVLDFQKLMGLSADGVVGKQTWTALADAQNVQREKAFPPQNLVSYNVTGSASRSPSVPSPSTPPAPIAVSQRLFPKWVFIPIGLALVGIVVGLVFRKRKGKRK